MLKKIIWQIKLHQFTFSRFQNFSRKIFSILAYQLNLKNEPYSLKIWKSFGSDVISSQYQLEQVWATEGILLSKASTNVMVIQNRLSFRKIRLILLGKSIIVDPLYSVVIKWNISCTRKWKKCRIRYLNKEILSHFNHFDWLQFLLARYCWIQS